MDLRGIFDPEAPLTPLYLLVLIRGLPDDCRFNAERRGGQEFRGWNAGRYASVAAVNALRGLQYTYVAAHSKSKPKPPEPFPIPDKRTRRKNTGPGSFAYIAAQKLNAVKQKKGG